MECTSIPKHRQRWKFKENVICPKKKLSAFGVQQDSILDLKDIGPQVNWQTVFYVEYAGPIVFYVLLYFFYYTQPKSQYQFVTFLCLMLHFIKRELETKYIHRFSHATMPIQNIFKNSFYYWFVSGALVGLDVFRPNAIVDLGSSFLYVCVMLFLCAESLNFYTHYVLRSLRPENSTIRRIPYGFGFNLVSCPNYLFESISWFSLCLLTRSYSVVLFTCLGTIQMYLWAIKKHKNYKKEFENYPKRRAMFPFIG